MPRDKPLGNWRFLKRVVVSFVFGLYFNTLPVSSPETIKSKNFLKWVRIEEVKKVQGTIG